MASREEMDRLRAEVAEWRRRAEIAEAIAAERLARAETAERALRAAEAALVGQGPAPAAPGPSIAAPPGEPGPASASTGTSERRPASLLERWRRYTDTIN